MKLFHIPIIFFLNCWILMLCYYIVCYSPSPFHAYWIVRILFCICDFLTILYRLVKLIFNLFVQSLRTFASCLLAHFKHVSKIALFQLEVLIWKLCPLHLLSPFTVVTNFLGLFFIYVFWQLKLWLAFDSSKF